MIKEVFENSYEKLDSIIREKLNSVNATEKEYERAESELKMIKGQGDAQLFLFLYELAKYMRGNGIYFGTRGLFYTSLYSKTPKR